MGIRGFMTYVRRYPDLLKSHDLNGGYLMIDGHSLASKLYDFPYNTAFGGDYRFFPDKVETFFDMLEERNVKPLVLLDGGDEVIDLQKSIIKKESRLKEIINYTPMCDKMISRPFSMMIVFNSILKRKGVKIIRCLSLADPHIARVAKILNCPVVTFDSELFMYGVKCIPIDSFDPTGNCKIFIPEDLSELFGGLPTFMFPLLSILLGNKYIESEIFENFFNCLKRLPRSRRLYNDEQTKIESTLVWLQNYNLNEAIAAIIEKVSEEDKQRVRKIIERVTDQHVNLPCVMLETLGLNEEYDVATSDNVPEKKFEFPGNIHNKEIKQILEENKALRTESSKSEDEMVEERMKHEVYNHDGKLNKKIVDSWPSWFARYYSMTGSPSYFANMMLHRFHDVTFRAEDSKYPSSMTMSLKIVRVIDGLLMAGREESSIGLLFLIRDGMTIVTRRLDTVRGTESIDFPGLGELRDTPMQMRKRIFDDTLEITGEVMIIEDIPDKWRLYVAVIVYWMKQNDEPLRNSCHMHAVLFTMLLGIVHKKTGFRQWAKRFDEANGKSEETKRPSQDFEIVEGTEGSMEDALKNVTDDDCVAIAPFFDSNCNVDSKLRNYRSGVVFKVIVAHVFTQLSASLRHAIALNDLLGCPYENPAIEELYNGTMLYNLYEKFEKEPNVEDYISATLAKSPSLLHLLSLLTDRVKRILDTKNKTP